MHYRLVVSYQRSTHIGLWKYSSETSIWACTEWMKQTINHRKVATLQPWSLLQTTGRVATSNTVFWMVSLETAVNIQSWLAGATPTNISAFMSYFLAVTNFAALLWICFRINRIKFLRKMSSRQSQHILIGFACQRWLTVLIFKQKTCDDRLLEIQKWHLATAFHRLVDDVIIQQS